MTRRIIMTKRGQGRPLLLAAVIGSCGPESAQESLADNVRAVCNLTGGPCNNGGVSLDHPEGRKWLDNCVEWQIEKVGGRIREEQGEACFQKYAELYACAGDWTCEEFQREVEDPCAELNDQFNAECGGLSPFEH